MRKIRGKFKCPKWVQNVDIYDIIFVVLIALIFSHGNAENDKKMEDENTRLENDYNATNAALKNVTEKYGKLEDENRIIKTSEEYEAANSIKDLKKEIETLKSKKKNLEKDIKSLKKKF